MVWLLVVKYIYSTGTEYSFGEQARIDLYNDPDCKYFIDIIGNVVERKMISIVGINEHIFGYFMLAADKNDIVYEWDTNEDTVREFGTLFDFLICHRESIYRTVVQNPNYPMYGKLL